MKKNLSKKKVEELRKRLVRKPQLVWDVLGSGEKKKVQLPSSTSYATTMDPLGERLILAVKPKNDQELTIFQFLVSDQKGINDLIASVATHKDFENYLRKVKNTKEVTHCTIILCVAYL